MKNLLIMKSLFFLLFLIFSCSEARVMDDSYKNMTLIDFASSDMYIDYDDELYKAMKAMRKTKQLKVSDYPYRAAAYRFYKNLKIIDNQLVLSDKDYKKLNISKRVFKIFKNEMDLNNKSFKMQEDGQQWLIDSTIINKFIVDVLK